MSDSDRPKDDPGATHTSGGAGDLGGRSGEPPAIRRLGDFEILREVGRGGMGVVYEARQVSLNRRVALKVLPPAFAMNKQARQRFEREAHAAAKLHHTNIVPVHAIGEQDGHHFYAMDLIEGQSLDVILDELTGKGGNPLIEAKVAEVAKDDTPRVDSSGDGATTTLSDTTAGGREWFAAVARLMADVADALEYAHGRGVVHRDIKPANLILSSDGRLCILDFGLARVMQEPGLTVSGSFLGTPAYMSPEQIAAGRVAVDHRTDVYSLGAVLYELLTLARPFPGDSREEVLSGVLTQDPRSPRRFNSKIPVDLETICLKAMEKAPDRRYQSAGEMARDLRNYLQGGLISARRAGLPRRVWKSVRRHPVVTISVAATLVVAVVGALALRAFTGAQQADVERLVSETRLLLVQGDTREAAELVERALAADPTHVAARLVKARIDMQRRHWVAALERARGVLETDPGNWEAHLILAVLGNLGIPLEMSIEDHLAAVEDDVPDTADAYYLRGVLADTNTEAVEWLDRALALDPAHDLALVHRSDRHLNLRDLPAALADAERLTMARPRSVAGYRQTAKVHFELHDEESATAAIDRAIELDPEDALSYFERSTMKPGRLDTWLVDLDRAIELDPEVAEFWTRRAETFREMNEFDRAIADARRAVELSPVPGDPVGAGYELYLSLYDSGRQQEAHELGVQVREMYDGFSWVKPESRAALLRGFAGYWMTMGKPERAIADAEEAIELEPDQMWNYVARANVLRLMEGDEAAIEGDCDRIAALEFHEPNEFLQRAWHMRDFCKRVDQALADYARAIELAPNWAAPYRSRAFLREVRELDIAGSIADLEKAVELAPKWVTARYDLAQTNRRAERFDEALAGFAALIEQGIDSGNLRDAQADILVRLGRPEEGIAVLDGFLETQPKNDTAWRARSAVLWNLGRLDEALQSIDRAVEFGPAHTHGYYDRARIQSFRLGDCDAIRQDLEKIHELVLEDVGSQAMAAWWALVLVGPACPELADVEATVEITAKALATDTRHWWHNLMHGSALYYAGRYEEAREKLKRAEQLDLHPNCNTLFHRAMVEHALGDAASARRYFDRAVARLAATYPDNPEFNRYREQVAAMLE